MKGTQAMRPLDARGTKQTCDACGARFYDLGRAEIACPACAIMFVPPPIEEVAAYDAAPPARKGWSRSARPAARPAALAVDPVEPVAEALDAEETPDTEDGEAEKADGFGDDLLLEADLTESDDDVVAVPRDEDAS